MTETETETQGSSAFGRSNGAPDASVMQDALLRLLRGQRAASEDRPALAADRLLSHLAFHPAAERSHIFSLSLATLFPEASASVVAAVPLPPTAALVAAPLPSSSPLSESGNSPRLWRELDLRPSPSSSSSSSSSHSCPLDAALAATLASAPELGAESLAEAAGAERRGGAAGALQSTLGRGGGRAPGVAASLARGGSPGAPAAPEGASSGLWLAEWEAGRHARVAPPPGLKRLVFSPSSSPEGGRGGESAAAAAKPLLPLLRPSDFFGGGDESDSDEENYGDGAREAPSTSDEDEEETAGAAAAAGGGGSNEDEEGADSLLASTASAAAAAAAAAPRVSARRRRGRDGTPAPPTAAATTTTATTTTSTTTAAAAASASSGGWAHRGDPRHLAAAFEALRPRLALRFPFELDRFQKESIALMEAGESVFVAAHTSAGKTAVAEYAVALAAAARGKALYCSPIKTISNQKFRDFSARFDTGLLTGDASVNPDAQCLVLTTEVLRSMLYRGADMIRDVEWVIFDEVHYVNDAERGVVWEEAIMLLPRRAKLVMLSATVPNVDEFAGWCGRTRGRCFWITGTTKRPVPLEHALWFPFGPSPSSSSSSLSSSSSSSVLSSPAPSAVAAAAAAPGTAASTAAAAKGQAFVVCSEALGWSSKGFGAAKAAWKLSKGGGGGLDRGGPASSAKDAKAARPTGRGGGGGGGGGGRGGGAAAGAASGGRGGRGQQQQQQPRGGGAAGSLARATANSNAASGTFSNSGPRTDAAQWRVLIAWLRARDLVPAAFFFFSKRKIDALAASLRSLDLNSAAERAEVSGFVSRALRRLPREDRDLPQCKSVADGLRRGVGVHHAGLLPILKEVVEMLFCRGLVKVLLCSETFAMGVNAPARAVAFAQLRKHDGAGFRSLLPGEYTQMAGRAGRRGLDKVGSVLVPVLGDAFPPPEELELRRVMTSPAARLESRFRLTPAMILNCARGEDLSVEALMRRSFAEFHAARAAPAAARRAAAARRRARELAALPWPPGWPRQEEVERYAELTDAADREDESGAGGGSREGASAFAVADAPGVLQALAPGRLVLARTTRSSPATLAVVVSSSFSRSGGSSSGGSGRSSGGSGREVVVLALVEGEEWPLVEPEEDETDGSEGGGRVGGGKKAPSTPSPSSLLVPLPSKKDDSNPFAGMRALSGKKSGTLGPQLAALSLSSASPPPSSSSSLESLGLPQRAEAAGVSFALSAVAPRLVDAVFSEKLPHLDCEGIIAAAAASASASSGSDPAAAQDLSSSPAAGAAALALRRARDDAASRSPPYPAPPLDPVSDLRVTGIEASAAARRRAGAVAARSALFPSLPPPPSAALAAALSRVRARRAAASRAEAEALAAGGAALEALPEYSARVDALVRLGYLEGSVVASSDPSSSDGGGGGGSPSSPASSGNGVALKGRVACELAAAHDGLALSEALFAGAFASLTSPADAAALLSCYVFQERSRDEDGDVFTCRMPSPALESAFATAVEAAAAVGRAHEDAGLIGRGRAASPSGGGGGGSEMLPASVDEWVAAALRPGLVRAVHAWASGAKFVEVCELTEAMEGTIVRTVMRVDEAARELRDAARVMGDTALWRQMERVSEAVRRDVAFAASLYVS